MPKGDLLIHAGDFTNQGRAKDIKDFDDWLGGLDYIHKIVVFGNHDTETDALAIKKAGRGYPIAIYCEEFKIILFQMQ